MENNANFSASDHVRNREGVPSVKPLHKKWLGKGSIPAAELNRKLSTRLFWSNPAGNIPIENAIVSVIQHGAPDDLDVIRFAFGDARVKEVFLKYFDVHSQPMTRDILGV